MAVVSLVNSGTRAVTVRYNRVLLVCHESVGKNMAGPAIRYWELARVLGNHFSVVLAHPGEAERAGPGFNLARYDPADLGSLASLATWADVVLAHGLQEVSALRAYGKPLVLDAYDVFIVENLEHHRYLPEADQTRVSARDLAVLNGQIRCGDFYICASERQRDFWLGMLAANGRINPLTFGDDRTMRKLIDVVPFGIRSSPPQHTAPALKGVRPKIATTDRLLLWGGGLWDWFDPETLVEALAEVCKHRADVKLFFMAKQHPDPTVVPEMRVASRTVELCRRLGLLNEHVFFGNWVPYEETANYLLEADIGVSLHLESLETRFAFRTRLMDYIWAGLPILASEGDALSEVVRSAGLGRTVRPGDVKGVATAIVEMLEEPSLRTRLAPNFARVAPQFTWERAAEPLVRFLSNPARAADRETDATLGESSAGERAATSVNAGATPYWQLPVKAWQRLRSGGIQVLVREIEQYVHWWWKYRR